MSQKKQKTRSSAKTSSSPESRKNKGAIRASGTGQADPHSVSPAGAGSEFSSVTCPSTPSDSLLSKSRVPEYVSLVGLLAVIAIVGFIFYEVMASFIVPLFLAALLVVIFRPFHRWLLDYYLGEHEKTAALATTAVIVLVVLIPILATLFLAVIEGRQLISQFNAVRIEEGIRAIRSSLHLNMPAEDQLRAIETPLSKMQQAAIPSDFELDRQRTDLHEIERQAKSLSNRLGLFWPDPDHPINPPSPSTDAKETDKEEADAKGADTKNGASSETSAESGDQLPGDQLPSPSPAPSEASSDSSHPQEASNESDASGDRVPEPINIPAQDHWRRFLYHLDQAQTAHFEATLDRPGSPDPQSDRQHLERVYQYQRLINDTSLEFSRFKTDTLGGKTKAWLIEAVNPSEEKVAAYATATVQFLKDKLFRFGGNAVAYLGNTLLGFFIMVIAIYFFLLDGPKMIESLKGLSPLDDDHEQELVVEFANVSRAVVSATLLSALAQGILAGIGFYFVGMESIFLLTVLSAVFAMVPFVGAAAVWFPCCLYLYFFENNLIGAIGLGLYGVLVISMADNVIKPYVLHGQSNLHPLLALLSVLGGVATLGPIGILVGPMVVAFLQTLLKILQSEMRQMELESVPP